MITLKKKSILNYYSFWAENFGSKEYSDIKPFFKFFLMRVFWVQFFFFLISSSKVFFGQTLKIIQSIQDDLFLITYWQLFFNLKIKRKIFTVSQLNSSTKLQTMVSILISKFFFSVVKLPYRGSIKFSVLSGSKTKLPLSLSKKRVKFVILTTTVLKLTIFTLKFDRPAKSRCLEVIRNAGA